jgi:hypothetical protein
VCVCVLCAVSVVSVCGTWYSVVRHFISNGRYESYVLYVPGTPTNETFRTEMKGSSSQSPDQIFLDLTC